MSNSHKLTADLLAMRPVMEAFLKGETIQVRGGYSDNPNWVDSEKPSWLPTVEYRIKPKPYEGWIAVHEDDNRNTSPVCGTKTKVKDWIEAVSRFPDRWKIIFVREVKEG